MKATSKPITIDYFEPNLDNASIEGKLMGWVRSFGDSFDDHFIVGPDPEPIKVKTLEGTSYNVDFTKDVIIRGIKGEYYPCKKNIFEATYDKVSAIAH